MDDDFGVVKEEIVEEDCPLPCFNGRVVSWLVSAGISHCQIFTQYIKRDPLWLDRKCHPCDIICRFVFGKSHNCKSQTAAPCSVMQIQAHSAVSLMLSPLFLLVRILR